MVVLMMHFLFLICLIGILAVISLFEKKLKNQTEIADKNHEIIKIYAQWLNEKQNKNDLITFFERNMFMSIAIYGMGFLGESLADELLNSSIHIEYAIDNNVTSSYRGIKIKKPSDNLGKVDAIVVTPIYYFDNIAEVLNNKTNCPIVSIEDVVYGV